MKRFKLVLGLCLATQLPSVFADAPIPMLQTCNDLIAVDTPDTRFTINADTTVTDNTTGLIWMRCALGQQSSNNTCDGPEQNYTWQLALQAADIATFAGYSDWRLPNVKELESLVENHCTSPAINLTVFPKAPGAWFWSSTPSIRDSQDAWGVNFLFGENTSSNKSTPSAVRLVRNVN